MKKQIRQQLLFPSGLILAFFLEGIIMKLFSSSLAGTFPMVPYLTLLWLIDGTLFWGSQHARMLYWAAFLMGAWYDSYFIGVIGIYMFIFPLVVYVTRLLLVYVDENLIGATMIYLIDIIIVLLLGYAGGRIGHLVYFSGIHFMAFAFGPTLGLNLILFLVLYYPIKRLFEFINNRS
ncbi:Rod shape-determining protein MreD [Fructilactobacillus florum 8D]|uniref:Rod shape-determining protein MreD n=2 Tax=Fructilactobacillus florum TaxID=640331 RepID=W9EF77_9LACO|nr:rod shape-determining protein MreD [Fructilactobacillus florum]EKK20898.1 Rod shape-determining protein MreD [Fructilactobacillus florum 2F]ETO39881.1 Rod shape-determining protein MreD [Fructilactobacillus florum 8D]KRM92433.1 rod shape-determining protein MreD [Fructilactobacillus florum DSM 22689 = JCM 16035]